MKWIVRDIAEPVLGIVLIIAVLAAFGFSIHSRETRMVEECKQLLEKP